MTQESAFYDINRDRDAQLRAGRAYNTMNDFECGTQDALSDPTGAMGWTMLTIEADRQANWDDRTYEEILEAKANGVIDYVDSLRPEEVDDD